MTVHSRFWPGALHPLSGVQAESWRLLWQELTDDAESAAQLAAWERAATAARRECAEVLEHFQAGSIELAELRELLDRRSKGRWSALGVRGSSGAMFLNRLAHGAGDLRALSAHLRSALRCPGDAGEASRLLTGFAEYLSRAAVMADVGAASPQPARAAFFLSFWWNVQDPERWPVFHPSAREALGGPDALFLPTGAPARDYITFRGAFLALATALRLTTSELAYLCRWRTGRPDDALDPDEPTPRRRARAHAGVPYPAPPGARLAVREGNAAGDAPAVRHEQVQWLLAHLGRALGCRVWIAANDRRRSWAGEPLGALSIPRLPMLGMDPQSQRLVGLIDVVWLSGANQVEGAFEVERTTSVHSGLLRMADLAALAPNLSFPLYVVVPRTRLAKVRAELRRPTFQRLGLHRRCGFFTAESLVAEATPLMRYGGGPDSIARLAERVGDGIAVE